MDTHNEDWDLEETDDLNTFTCRVSHGLRDSRGRELGCLMMVTFDLNRNAWFAYARALGGVFHLQCKITVFVYSRKDRTLGRFVVHRRAEIGEDR